MKINNQQLADQPRSWRPSKIVGIVKRNVEKIKYKKGKSTRKCSKDFKSTGVDVSYVTVYNYQLLTKMQRQQRLQFAREHKHLTAEDWEKYIFSDESTKYLFLVPN